MPENVFVLGLDDANRASLAKLPHAAEMRFHPLLTISELKRATSLVTLLDKAESELDEFAGSVDAILGYWDFPVSSMVPILCQRRGLPSASLEAVLKCEHKYWSRLEQQEAITEYPKFSLIGLADRTAPTGMRYPMWIKPVKAYSSELAFKVSTDEELRAALDTIRSDIGRVGAPFTSALSHIDLPQVIADVGGQACLVEESVSGQQVTVEGFHDGETVHVYGVVDTYTYEGASSFQRYQYPSKLPERVIDRLAAISRRVIDQIDLRWVFNIEYFWDSATDTIRLLEVNPRHSQSHAKLFERVDGVPNHHCMVELALGRTPHMPYRRGEYTVAAKWFYRHFSDAVVRRVPTAEEVAAIESTVPGVHVEISVRPGTRLSELSGQDSYSYSIAVVHTGSDTEDELVGEYERCVRALPFEFDE